MRRYVNLLVSSFGLMLLVLVSGAFAVESKGVNICPDNQVCLDINQSSFLQNARLNPTPSRSDNTSPEDKVPTAQKNSQTDISLLYRYSDSKGTGKQHTLDSGSQLHSGDKFTISVQAHKDVYLYLYHFDSSGQLNELVTLSGFSNSLKAGDTLLLPSANKHFKLDNNAGTETIHTIVSRVELTSLHSKYKNKLLSNQYLVNATPKGVVIESDQPALGNLPPSEIMTAPTTGRVVGCQAPEFACRETFTIRHLARP